MEPAPRSLDELRRAARSLENKIESTLVSFSSIASSSSAGTAAQGGAGVGGEAEGLQEELVGLLEQLEEVNEAMSRHGSSAAGDQVASLHTLQRHREILRDYQAEFSKTCAGLKAARDRAQLLDSVRADIRDHRRAASSGVGGGDSASLLRERTAIHHAVRLADEVIDRAAATQAGLHDQRSGFGNIQRNLGALATKLPAVGSLIGAISARKRRDVMVLSATAAVCFFLLFWAVLG